jgi:hypothetical protein
LYNAWNFPKNRADCEAAGGKFILAFKTLGTQWVPGILRRGTWVTPTVVPVAEESDVFDYQKFSTDLNLALAQLYFVDESAPSVCRLESPLSSLRNLLKQCLPECVEEEDKNMNVPCEVDELVYLSRGKLFCVDWPLTLFSYPL